MSRPQFCSPFAAAVVSHFVRQKYVPCGAFTVRGDHILNPLRLLPLVLMLAACGARTEPAVVADPALEAGWTGRTQPMEIIHARFELMTRIEMLMHPIDAIQLEPVRNADQLRTNARA